ncbi:unnamed protein product [Calicophoron daubneyi]|uniref:Cytochrome b-c1 complex subunit Rieske, mitochondrial n=1 Tax=Calicophoron daubneyi TaxID=300641 RepID=A0AAV2TKL3_CALDB
MSSCRLLASAEAAAATRTVPLALEKVCSIPTVPKKRRALYCPPQKSFAFGPLPRLTVCSASCGLSVPLKIRFTHTDVTNVPDFSNYRAESTKDPTSSQSETHEQRKVFGYTMMLAGASVATVAAKYTVKTFLMPLGPTAKTLAEASTEVNLSSIPEGKNLVVKWRNKPLFVRHRTAEEIERERAVPLSELRHPEKDEDRTQRSEWLICLGVCTHLGCVPLAHAGDYPGGYYCPCHGSHYDASGRVRRGPAPLNLDVPDYKFLDDNTVLIG